MNEGDERRAYHKLTKLVQAATSLDRYWVIGTHTEDADCAVVQGGSERGGKPFNVTKIGL